MFGFATYCLFLSVIARRTCIEAFLQWLLCDDVFDLIEKWAMLIMCRNIVELILCSNHSLNLWKQTHSQHFASDRSGTIMERENPRILLQSCNLRAKVFLQNVNVNVWHTHTRHRCHMSRYNIIFSILYRIVVKWHYTSHWNRLILEIYMLGVN